MIIFKIFFSFFSIITGPPTTGLVQGLLRLTRVAEDPVTGTVKVEVITTVPPVIQPSSISTHEVARQLQFRPQIKIKLGPVGVVDLQTKIDIAEWRCNLCAEHFTIFYVIFLLDYCFSFFVLCLFGNHRSSS